MRAEDFIDSAPGQLVPTHGTLAFVPEPLPDHVELDGDTVQILARAENQLGRLEGTAAREFNPYLVGSPLLHREAILSSRMEGTITTPEELVLFQAESETEGRRVDVARPDDAREVMNYIHAMRRGLELLQEIPVCLRLVREIHRVLMTGARGERERPGEFRTDQNWIRGNADDDIRNARYVPPPVRQMRNALDRLEEYLNIPPEEQRDPVLVRLALVHYQFEAIHPFRDGNGRVGRLLLPLLLCGYGRLDAPVLYLSAFFERHRQEYIDRLLWVSQRGDFCGWIRFFLRAVKSSAGEANSQALALLELRRSYHRQFQKGRSSALLIRLIDRLFQVPSITIGNAAELLDVTPQAAANNIHKLEEVGILREATGKQRNQVFVADQILGFMYDTPEIPAEENSPAAVSGEED